MDDIESHRPPDDDLSFPGDLDRGLDAEPAVGAPNVKKPLVPPDRATANRRPLLALFPPPAPGPIVTPPVSRAQSRPPSFAGPAPSPDVDPTSLALSRGALTYETFYGLREKPFSRAADSRFLYHSTSHDRTAQVLVVSIARRAGLVVLTGDAGTGKTMLCRGLLERIDRRTFTSFVTDPFVTLEDLLKEVLLGFGVISRTEIAGGRLAGATRQELSTALHEFLLSLVQINGFAVVFIDDAQTLSADMLTQVQEIADTDRALMGIVLIGQAELLLKLGPRNMTSGVDRESVRARLDPLAEDEIAGYVLHRLTVASASAGRLRVEFNDAALALVYEISRGMPQLVNLLCDRALARGFGNSATLIDAPLVESAARDLDLPVPRRSTSTAMRKVLMAVALVGLVLLAAAAGVFVFRAQLSRAVADWAAPPPPPSAPALETAAPLETRPPPSDEPPRKPGTR